MTFKLPEDLTKVDPKDLDKLHADAIEAYAPLADVDDIDDDQLDELEVLAKAIESIEAEQSGRAVAAEERAARVEAARNRLATAKDKPADEVEQPAEETAPGEETNPEAPADETTDVEQPLDVEIPNDASELVDENEKEPVMASAKESVVKRAVGRIAEPQVPTSATEVEKPSYSMVAAGDVRGFSAGQEMSVEDLTTAFAAKINSFVPGQGSRSRTDKFAIAQLNKPMDPATTIFARDSAEVASEKLQAVMDGRNTEQESLVAAGDWGAPSQIIYDIPQVEQAPDGLLTLPSITVERGGFQHTLGIDFSVITGDANFGFTQTETQAAAKTVKPIIEPTNPTFQDERLKVIGYGLQAGILTLKGYPELIKRYTSGTATAFAKYRNKDTITRFQALFPNTPTATAARGSVAQDLLDTVAFHAARLRYKYSLKRTQTFEIALPFWALDVIREDLAKRQGWDSINVPDSYINGLLSSRGVTAQWIKDWTVGDLSGSATAYPATIPLLMWMAGTFVKGGGPVVSYDAVYDYDHISTNTYVVLFREESTLVAKMLNVESLYLTIASTQVQRDGRTGKDDFDIARA